jgi:hypothetical protein
LSSGAAPQTVAYCHFRDCRRVTGAKLSWVYIDDDLARADDSGRDALTAARS